MCPGHPNSWPSRASPSGDPRVLGALSNPPLTLDFLLPRLPLTTSAPASTPTHPAPTQPHWLPSPSFLLLLVTQRLPAAHLPPGEFCPTAEWPGQCCPHRMAGSQGQGPLWGPELQVAMPTTGPTEASCWLSPSLSVVTECLSPLSPPLPPPYKGALSQSASRGQAAGTSCSWAEQRRGFTASRSGASPAQAHPARSSTTSKATAVWGARTAVPGSRHAACAHDATNRWGPQGGHPGARPCKGHQGEHLPDRDPESGLT